MDLVVGIGGVFIYANNPEQLADGIASIWASNANTIKPKAFTTGTFSIAITKARA
jgi:hypothetical protein